MEELNYKRIKASGYKGYILEEAPEKILQFGEGNFLRAFVDYWFDVSNERVGWNGKAVLVQPIAQGLAEQINRQEGLYTLYPVSYTHLDVYKRQALGHFAARFAHALLGKRFYEVVRPQAGPAEDQKKGAGTCENQADSQHGGAENEIGANADCQQCAADNLKPDRRCAEALVIRLFCCMVHWKLLLSAN